MTQTFSYRELLEIMYILLENHRNTASTLLERSALLATVVEQRGHSESLFAKHPHARRRILLAMPPSVGAAEIEVYMDTRLAIRPLANCDRTCARKRLDARFALLDLLSISPAHSSFPVL